MLNPSRHSPSSSSPERGHTGCMASVMIRCSGTKVIKKDDAETTLHCERRLRIFAPKGATIDPNEKYTCEGCKSGKDPFVPRSSERKGQQKQSKKK